MKAILRFAIAPAIMLSACARSGHVAGPPPRPAPPLASSHATANAPRPLPPSFHGSVEPVDPVKLRYSWRQGCPVVASQLRLLTLDHWDFHGEVQRGELVVNAKVAADVVEVFSKLFDARFPIARMELVDTYGGDDDRSMAADNTSAFNCRSSTGHPGVWSEHSYGWAIDINPVENPYISAGGTVAPPSGSRYSNRSLRVPGMILSGDPAVEAFDAIGWGWGGRWSSIKDYQHFSLTGR